MNDFVFWKFKIISKFARQITFKSMAAIYKQQNSKKTTELLQLQKGHNTFFLCFLHFLPNLVLANTPINRTAFPNAFTISAFSLVPPKLFYNSGTNVILYTYR